MIDDEDQIDLFRSQFKIQDDEIERLRKALKECAANFTTKSSDHRTAAQEILDEFERRALIARAALKRDE